MDVKHILKSHNKSLLIYQLVCPVKYRRKVFTEEVENTLKEICIGIENRYEIYFIEVGADDDHIHFLIQSVPTFSPTQLTNKIKGITSRKIFEKYPHIKKNILWGGHFWTAGYYINTVGKFASLEMMKNYIKNQGVGKSYKKIYVNKNQLSLFT